MVLADGLLVLARALATAINRVWGIIKEDTICAMQATSRRESTEVLATMVKREGEAAAPPDRKQKPLIISRSKPEAHVILMVCPLLRLRQQRATRSRRQRQSDKAKQLASVFGLPLPRSGQVEQERKVARRKKKEEDDRRPPTIPPPIVDGAVMRSSLSCSLLFSSPLPLPAFVVFFRPKPWSPLLPYFPSTPFLSVSLCPR